MRSLTYAPPRIRRLAAAALCRALPFSAAILLCAPAAPADRTLNFPDDHSLGTVLIRSAGSSDGAAWESRGAATGAVAIPDGMEVRLSLQRPSVSDVESLAKMGGGNLTEIAFADPEASDDHLRPLASLATVRRLDLGGTSVKGPGLGYLVGMTTLRALDLSDTKIEDRALEFVARFEALEELSLARTQVSAKGISRLREIATLRELDLAGVDLDGAALAEVAALADLRALTVSARRREAPRAEMSATLAANSPAEALFADSLVLLAQMRMLRSISVDGEQLDDAALERLSAMSQLEELRIGAGNRVTDDGLKHLSKLTGLKKLALVSPGKSSKISDDGLKHLEPLAALESLELRCSRVTDAGLDHLANLAQLRELNLKDTSVNDVGLGGALRSGSSADLGKWWGKYSASGLKNLAKLKQLKLLVIPQQVSLEGYRALRKALPECSILRR